MNAAPLTSEARFPGEWVSRFSLERLIGILGALLIVTPKINLISVAGQNAGLRIDDVLILLSWIPLSAFVIRSGIGGIRSYGYLTFIGFSFVSMAIAAVTGWPPHLLFPLRLLEYSTFLFFGILYARHFRLEPLLQIIVFANGILMIPQFFGLIGGFTVTGYDSAGRVVGLTAGPWEIGYMLDVIYAVLVSQAEKKSVFFLLQAAVIFLLLLMTASRAATAVYLCITLAYMLKGVTLGKLFVRLVIGGAVLAAILFAAGDELVSRSTNLLSADNVDYVVDYVNNSSALGSFDEQEFDDVAELSGSADQSWIIRSTHWIIAMKEWSSSTIHELTGVGMGTFGPALDGAWVRILTETGIIGVLLYLAFLFRIAALLPGGWLIAFSTIANMFFIDIHLSYKSMALLLFMVGYCQIRRTPTRQIMMAPQMPPHVPAR